MANKKIIISKKWFKTTVGSINSLAKLEFFILAFMAVQDVEITEKECLVLAKYIWSELITQKTK